MLALPGSGRIGLFNAPGDVDLSAIRSTCCHAVQRMEPDTRALVARGLDVSVTPCGPSYQAVVVYLPRARAYARQLISEAWHSCGPHGVILIDGQKTDGIDSVMRELKALLGSVNVYSKAHGRLIWFERSSDDQALRDFAPPWQASPDGFLTAPGVFSADRVDAGSRLLAGCLPELAGRAADFGAGWGYLSRAILENPGIVSLDLVEADATALDCARHNVKDLRARFHWADATRFDGGPYDVVVMNPPFHAARAATPELGQAFIARAAQRLTASGSLWLVANRHLPYEKALEAAFRRVEPIGRDPAFKVLHAQGPRRSR